MDDLLKDAAVLIGAILLYIFDKIWKRREAAKEKAAKASQSGIEIVHQIDKDVKHEERKLKQMFHAMRMFVMHFSNGTFTDAGLSLFKISIKHEVLEGYYVEPLAHNFQEVALPDMFLKPVTMVVRKGIYYMKSSDDLDEKDVNEKSLKDWLSAYQPGIKSMLWVELKNGTGKIVAILCMHFPIANAVSDSDIIKIKDMKRSIEYIYNSLGK